MNKLTLTFFSLILSTFLSGAKADPTEANQATKEVVQSAIRDLVADNKDFFTSKSHEHFKEFLDIQNPRTTTVLCSDSRVQMDNFSQGAENDMFVVRNIGNQIATSEGSVDYGVGVLKTPVLLIVGHSHCGAVKAARESVKGLPKPIKKDLASLHVHSAPNDKAAVVLNVNNQVDSALKSYKDRVEKHELAIIGAVYDFRDDYGLGKGRLIIVNVNGETDPKKIKDLHYFDGIKTVTVGISKS